MDATEASCGTCGLHNRCSRCAEPYEDPTGQRFCAGCGSQVVQPEWAEAASAPEILARAAVAPGEPPEAAGEPSEPAGERRRSRRGFGALFEEQHSDPGAAAPSSGSRLARRGARMVKRTARRMTMTIGRLYLELAEALLEEHRLEEAVEAYRRALAEDEREGAWRSRVYASLAESTIEIARTNETLRPEALRTALEASLRARETLARTAQNALELAAPTFLEEHGAWVSGSWRSSLGELVLDAQEQIYTGLLVVRCALYIGSYREAVQALDELQQRQPALVKRYRPQFMREPLVAPAIQAAGLADTHWILSQVLEITGDDTRALSEVEAALAAGFEPGAEVELSALRKRAELLSRQNAPERAAAGRLELGRALVARGQIADAIPEFERAAAGDATAAEPWWQLADAVRSAASLNEPPRLDLGMVERAHEALEHGLAIRLPAGAHEAWVYCLQAIVAEQMAYRDDSPTEGRWRALLGAERALVLDADSGDAWALHSRYCRLLGLYANALASHEQAVALAPRNPLVAQEAVLLHTEATPPLAAVEAIRPYTEALGTGAGLFHAVTGYLLLLAGDEQEAGERLETAVTRGDEPFRRLFRGITRALIDGRESGLQDIRWAHEQTMGCPEYVAEHAVAAALLGDDSEAVDGFGALARRTGQETALGAAGLAWCAAMRGDAAQAGRQLEEAIDQTRVPGCEALVRLTVRLIAMTCDPRNLAAPTLGDRLAGLDDSRLALDRSAAAAAEELHGAAAEAAPGSVAWVAGRAAEARSAMAERDWRRALRAYDEIDDHGRRDWFPELRALRRRCLKEISLGAEQAGEIETVEAAQTRLADSEDAPPWEQAVAVARAHQAAASAEAAAASLATLRSDGGVTSPQASVEVADVLIGLGRLAEAKETLLLGLDAPPAGSPNRWRIETRLGVLAALGDDIADARQWLLHAVASVPPRDEIGVSAVVEEAGRAAGAAGDANGRKLDTALRFLVDHPRLASVQRRELVSARFERSRERHSDRTRVRTVSPVLLSLEARVLPDGPQSEISRRLTEGELPRLRDRLRARVGMRLPGVRVQARAQSAPDRDYELLVREVPAARGRLPANDGDVDVTQLHSQLERVLRVRIAEFIGLSEVTLELDDWVARGSATQRAAQVGRALPHRDAREHFARVVHRLLEEQVPLRDLDALLAAYAETRERELDLIATIEHIRLALAGGFDMDVLEDAITLDPAVEESIERHVAASGGARALAIPADEAAAILASLADDVEGRGATVVRVQRDGLRPFVQRLVESRWRGVLVISAAEAGALAVGPASTVSVSAR
jgi:tetratricopeptide (TPR) repeat protein